MFAELARLFELADLFTPSVDPKEHARFLQRLFHCVAEGCPEPLYLWRNEVDVEYGGYALPTEGHTALLATLAEHLNDAPNGIEVV